MRKKKSFEKIFRITLVVAMLAPLPLSLTSPMTSTCEAGRDCPAYDNCRGKCFRGEQWYYWHQQRPEGEGGCRVCRTDCECFVKFPDGGTHHNVNDGDRVVLHRSWKRNSPPSIHVYGGFLRRIIKGSEFPKGTTVTSIGTDCQYGNQFGIEIPIN